MSQLIIGYCPVCGGEILHDVQREEDYEICGLCGTKSSVASLKEKPSATVNAQTFYAGGAESALAYVTGYFDNYDWDGFMDSAELSVGEADEIAGNILMTCAANPAAWELAFTAVYYPLCKKINGLKKIEEKFLSEYVIRDALEESLSVFALYSAVVNKIAAGKEHLTAKLTSYLNNHKKYNGAPSVTAHMKSRLEALCASLETFRPINSHKELAGFPHAEFEKQRRIAERLSVRSVDVEAVYNEAVAEYNSGINARHALTSFKAASGYKEADEYARRIDGWAELSVEGGSLIKLGKKYYFAGGQPDTGMDVYPINDNKISTEPCISGVTRILAHFGGNMFYIKNGGSVCVFDSQANPADAETVIVSASRSAFEFIEDADGKILQSDNKLFFKRKLNTVAEDTGKKGRSAKKSAPVDANKNVWSLSAVSLTNNKLEMLISEMVDVCKIAGNDIFFNKISYENGVEKEEFLVYNLSSRELRFVFTEATHIIGVTDGRVIYEVPAPNEYNINLFSRDLRTRATVKLASNVCGYYDSIDGRVYYFVGNEEHKALYSVNADGTDVKEVVSRAEYLFETVAVGCGNIYAVIGEEDGLNNALVKINAESGKVKAVCPHFKRLISLSCGCVFYEDANGGLCFIREDASGYKKIADRLEGFASVTRDGVYLLRGETVGKNEDGTVISKSLYRINYDGSGLVKVAFDVAYAVKDGDGIYVYSPERLKYSLSVPVDKDNYETSVGTAVVNTISLYDTVSGTFTEIASFGGLPSPEQYVFKKGKFGKSVVRQSVVTRLEN